MPTNAINSAVHITPENGSTGKSKPLKRLMKINNACVTLMDQNTLRNIVDWRILCLGLGQRTETPPRAITDEKSRNRNS